MLKYTPITFALVAAGFLLALMGDVYGQERSGPVGGAQVRLDLSTLLKPDHGRDARATSAQKPEKKPSPLQRLGITITVFSLFENNTLQPDTEYQKYKNVVDIVGHRGNWSFGAQLRSVVFSDEERVPADDFERTSKFTLYRRYLEYTGAGYSFRAGDFNQSLGNGLTLFLQQDQALRLDHTIDGGRFGFRWGRLETSFLGGVVDQATNDDGAIDPVLFRTKLQDRLLGARVVGHLPRRATVGVNLTQFFYEARAADRQQVGSLEFKVPDVLDRFDVSGEFSVTRRTLDPDSPFSLLQAEHGRAVYLALTADLLGGTSLIEYKNYRDVASPYTNPPNLARTDDIFPNTNVRGFRARYDRTFIKTGTTAYVSFTQQNGVTSRAFISSPSPFASLVFAGLEQSLQDDRWYIRGIVGRRYEHYGPDSTLSQVHATVDVNRRFWGRHSLGLLYDGRYTDVFLVREKDERLTLSYGWSPYLVFSLLTARQRNISKETDEVIPESKQYSLGPELVCTPTSSWFVKVFVGRLPGGLVCSGGLCRQENAFRGFRGSVSYRF